MSSPDDVAPVRESEGFIENRGRAVTSLSRFAKATGLLALGLACSHSPPVEEPEAGEAGPARRRIAEGCDRVEEARGYDAYVGQRALAILSWTGMPERAANLKIPIYVVGIDEGVIGVRFLEFPLREQYLNVWLGSGHVVAAGENLFLLDPCSATLEPWPGQER